MFTFNFVETCHCNAPEGNRARC